MSLHRLASLTMGVPDVQPTIDYYADFGLTHLGHGRFATTDGGEQLRIVYSPNRRLVDVAIGADDHDDLGRVTGNLAKLGVFVQQFPEHVTAIDLISDVRVTVNIVPRVSQKAQHPTPYNGPGRFERTGARAPGVMRHDRVMPRKLGHVVIGSVDYEATRRFFVEGIGFRESDHIKGEGSFLRCSIDHHNLLVLKSPVNYLHHTSWQVNDIDDVGRGAYAMLEDNPERHVWGLGRHFAGSNFFWYLKDPAGNFSEYYSDMDCIPEEEIWKPEVLEGVQGLFSWGPPPPPSFLHPEDLAALMTGVHGPKS
ncbi:dioxygenase [Subtercola boreus]|uniref:Dioxygenase n=1 Tax=Subtercola boreus TaxID=120213 RepID=A0A3E0VCL6_9MICO|nr:VOC family protein [Subtercola boreus]RFA06637.1 dioxygenase [Subtercola boreus]